MPPIHPFSAILIFHFLILMPLQSQVYYHDEAPYAPETEARNLYLEALDVQESFVQSGFRTEILEIFEIDSQKFMVIDGRMNLYAWQNNHWSNISRSKYHGYNHHSRKYKYNNTLYSYGGYGFWRQHGDLIQYDWERNEWETVPLQAQKDLGTNATFLFGEYLYLIHPESKNQHLNQTSEYRGLIRIDLRSGQTENFKTDRALDQLESKLRLETENYFLVSRDPFQIIDKRHLKCKFSDITYALDLSQQNVGSFIWIMGDSISLLADRDTRDYISTQMEKIYKNAPFPETELIEKDNYFIMGALGLLIISTGYLYYRRKKRLTMKIDFSNPIIEKVIELSGKILTQEELDVVFGIELITPAETQRSKRSNIYNEVNNEFEKKYGVKLINRIQDPLDKRKYLYQIEASKKQKGLI